MAKAGRLNPIDIHTFLRFSWKHNAIIIYLQSGMKLASVHDGDVNEYIFEMLKYEPRPGDLWLGLVMNTDGTFGTHNVIVCENGLTFGVYYCHIGTRWYSTTIYGFQKQFMATSLQLINVYNLRFYPPGGWTWVDGSELEFEQWGPDQKTFRATDDVCGSLDFDKDGNWTIDRCYNRKGWICTSDAFAVTLSTEKNTPSTTTLPTTTVKREYTYTTVKCEYTTPELATPDRLNYKVLLVPFIFYRVLLW